jgi:translation elongation factor EF-Tu-like GTPase
MPSYLKARVEFYSSERGGRPFVPIRDGYAPYVRSAATTQDLPVRVNGMPINGKYEMPYDVEVELMYHPKIDYSALVEGTEFTLVEGTKTVGEGAITSPIYER